MASTSSFARWQWWRSMWRLLVFAFYALRTATVLILASASVVAATLMVAPSTLIMVAFIAFVSSALVVTTIIPMLALLDMIIDVNFAWMTSSTVVFRRRHHIAVTRWYFCLAVLVVVLVSGR
jgi:hypothetical protein